MKRNSPKNFNPILKVSMTSWLSPSLTNDDKVNRIQQKDFPSSIHKLYLSNSVNNSLDLSFKHTRR